MSLEGDLTDALLEAYQRAGDEVAYWAGLDALLEAGRPDLTMEAVILQPQFRSLFSQAEAGRRRVSVGLLTPDLVLR
jgi:hypothetical protein